MRTPVALPPNARERLLPSDRRTNLHHQLILVTREIERTRRICERSLELLRLPVPSTFLGKKLEPLPASSEQRALRVEIADYLHSKEN